MKEKRRKRIFSIISAVFMAAALGIGAAVFWHWINLPCIMRMDCRGKGVDVETVKRWEEEEKNGSLGILRIAGWRVEEEAVVFSVSTGRRATAKMIGVYGAMELVEKAGVQCGRYGLDVEEGYCVLSEKLAGELFGSGDIAGEYVSIGQESWFVAGVIEKEGVVFLKPVREGELEMLAVEFDNKIRVKERFTGLMGE